MNSTKSEPLLKIEKLTSGYGPTQILNTIDLEVRAGEIVVVVGPNGAGKTTLLNTISGLTTVSQGSVQFAGTDITRMNVARIPHLGLSHCPEGRRILTRLTVEENLIAACIDRNRSFEEKRDDVYTLFPILHERRHGSAQRLSGGQQQMLAIGRCLMAEPSLVMMDEPSLGLAPKLIAQIFRIIVDLANRGIAILLVEQNVRLALEIGDYAYLFESGRCRLEGGAKRIAEDPSLIDLYLGAHGQVEH
ncbi:ABC transporter ATP-binding protein [Pararhizobium polonicum]|uniref:ABC transporter ATP-binding protein n=1 Tax=Pararhizobium polonicum TaxID=1612624 RepID=UPI0009F38627|nr:ABC transporter ATP-binding protein [Pararhizobium polonicum]